MKFSSKKTKILIIILGISLILSLNFFQKEVKSFFYLISSPIQKSLWRAGDRTSDFFETIAKIKNLKKENEELKLKIQELLSKNSSLKELKKENEILREALGIGLQEEFQLTFAEVTSKDVSQDSILINRGLKDRISEGMPVITQQKALVGKISEVYENFSRIILISNKESSFDAKVADSDIPVLIKGKGSLKILLDFVPQDKNIEEGNLIITTSLGGIYPKGLLIGLITEVKKGDIKPFQQAEVSPFFNISNLENLFIITNF